MTDLETLKNSTIMMVDDEPTTLDVLEVLLQELGYRNFVKATDSRQVLGLLAERKPDVLILNLVMPHVDGMEILASMRRDETLAAIPVIILTSSTDPTTRMRALDLGATDFLGKPVDASELALRLQNTLAAGAYREQLDRSGSASATPGPADEPIVSRLAARDARFLPIVRKFLGRLEAKIATMEAACASGDLGDLEDLAHWLQGAAGTVGLDDFTAPAENLKLLAREGKRDEIEPLVRELRELSERVVTPDENEG